MAKESSRHKDKLYETVISIVAEYLGKDESLITPNGKISDLFDARGIEDLMRRLTVELNIPLSAMDLPQGSTFAVLVNYVRDTKYPDIHGALTETENHYREDGTDEEERGLAATLRRQISQSG